MCLIGQQRGYLATEEEKAEAARCAFLKERVHSPGKPPSLTHLSTSSDAALSGGSEWCKAFRPRPKSSTLSRNCSQVDPLLRDHIVATVAEVLLQAPLRQDGEMRVMQGGGPWLCGGGCTVSKGEWVGRADQFSALLVAVAGVVSPGHLQAACPLRRWWGCLTGQPLSS